MATIVEVLRSGVVREFSLPTWETREPQRPLYVAQQLVDWVESNREAMFQKPSRNAGGRTRSEHLLTTLSDFRCAERPGGGDLRRLMPTKEGVWKLHPPGLRAYCFFCAPHALVAVDLALEEDTKADKGLNDAKMQGVLSFLREHGLQQTILRGDRFVVLPRKT